ncbi:reverse transcriptase domain-containing protein [Pontiella sulfatireligans]|uniref:Reverse transcriptase domain-containing protein n=1 Tax=Pontiella sulfatireligans TaxID=2750658 RepID=A0A6C2UHU1_9BACT|nr:reverse transcriptase domain-containing protein [Pontiella sulfatireligans]VGO19519.1 hypothetical protein SCARR_01578 [Pontiella sulfatireligans]
MHPLDPLVDYGISERGYLDIGDVQLELLPDKVHEQRQKLYQKAKAEPKFRFYALYDRVYRKDVLEAAFKHVGKRGKAAGVDGVTAEELLDRENGVKDFLEMIHEELCAKTYRASPAKRVNIPKAGGVISPLLANVYLHWFDHMFHRKDGPRHWANARLVRYADDFVILARYQGSRIDEWVKGTIEEWMGLRLNQEKTKTVKLWQDEQLDFLGYTFQNHRDLHGRDKMYLNVYPSKKSMKRARQTLKEKTNSKKCFKPATEVVKDLNRYLQGWGN